MRLLLMIFTGLPSTWRPGKVREFEVDRLLSGRLSWKQYECSFESDVRLLSEI